VVPIIVNKCSDSLGAFSNVIASRAKHRDRLCGSDGFVAGRLAMTDDQNEFLTTAIIIHAQMLQSTYQKA
jgi:hypothetical protein